MWHPLKAFVGTPGWLLSVPESGEMIIPIVLKLPRADSEWYQALLRQDSYVAA